MREFAGGGDCHRQTGLYISAMTRRHRAGSGRGVRDRILRTAAELFYKRGVQNVGVDQVVAEAGVAKMSLYKHFGSKDALVEAGLRHQSETWRLWFEQRVLATSPEVDARILGIFEALEVWFGSTDFRGSPFTNVAVEVADAGHGATRAAMDHQRAVLAFVRDLARNTGVSRPEMLARQLLLLMEGATVLAQVHGGVEPAREARRAAQALLGAQRHQSDS